MSKIVAVIPVLALCFLLATCAYSEGGHTHQGSGGEGGPIELSAQLRGLLRKEMAAIQGGMQALVPVIAAGEWQRVAEIGKRIERSYILKQALSGAQIEELHRALPSGFQALDGAFHRHAGMLAHAAEMENGEVVGFYFYKLTEGCVSCHSQYARHRFPALSGEAPPAGHDH